MLGFFTDVLFFLELLFRVWDYKFMARVADKIKLIDGSREALKLSIRITDLWYIGIPGKTEQVEMVVIDSDVCFCRFLGIINYVIILLVIQ